MTQELANRPGLLDRGPWESRLERALETGSPAHPAAALALSVVAVGAGMLLAVSVFTLLLAVPMGLLLGWF